MYRLSGDCIPSTNVLTLACTTHPEHPCLSQAMIRYAKFMGDLMGAGLAPGTALSYYSLFLGSQISRNLQVAVVVVPWHVSLPN